MGAHHARSEQSIQFWRGGSIAVSDEAHTVMSGKWLPPASCGWLETRTSPSSRPPASGVQWRSYSTGGGATGCDLIRLEVGEEGGDSHLVSHSLLHRAQVNRDVRGVLQQTEA